MKHRSPNVVERPERDALPCGSRGGGFGASARSALTLLEVVLATAILAASLAVLGQLLETGRQAGLRAARELEALNRAESLLAVAVAGSGPGIEPEAVEEQLEDGWTLSLEVGETEYETLRLLTATASHVGGAGTEDASVTLHRLLHIPPEAEE